MSIEQELKQLMIAKSSSVRQFAIDVELPYTTIMSMLNKGIGNAGVNKIIKICDYLKIDVDALAERVGTIESVEYVEATEDEIKALFTAKAV